jgi:hypothetical protein
VALLLIQGYVGIGMSEKVRSSDFLVDWLPQIVTDIGMVPVGKPIVEEYAHWEGSAPSAVQFIEAPVPIPTHTTGVQIVTASAVTVHTYPNSFFQILIDSCRPIPNRVRVKNKIMASLCMREDLSRYIPEWGWRGTDK